MWLLWRDQSGVQLYINRSETRSKWWYVLCVLHVKIHFFISSNIYEFKQITLICTEYWYFILPFQRKPMNPLLQSLSPTTNWTPYIGVSNLCWCSSVYGTNSNQPFNTPKLPKKLSGRRLATRWRWLVSLPLAYRQRVNGRIWPGCSELRWIIWIPRLMLTGEIQFDVTCDVYNNRPPLQ